ncbi:von Willebrand factor type A domain-containing protein [Colwellia sp. E2M01]|uniref:vWA domain-containing protein n=1 Tax=Colwellia sp. E2M01 TaxID=2841561 RepID=UPI001C090D96|nr:von Willebrand factor type A domain-containing protein [Colwellia sp. E2M01]MBU2871117.1 von Willebrand factor type A domain-containing protein [Colwellia sp. E2M01]
MNKHILSLITVAVSIALLTNCSSQMKQDSADEKSTPEVISANQQKEVDVIDVQGMQSDMSREVAAQQELTAKNAEKSAIKMEKRERAPAPPVMAKTHLAQARSTSSSLAVMSEQGQGFESDVQPMPEILLEPKHSQNAYQIFKKYGVNPTLETRNTPVSTFSMDVDNGSYRLAADMLNRNRLPNIDGIRIEEFINAFDYDYTPSKDTFGISAQVFPSPNREGYHVLHLGVQTKKLKDIERNPSNLVLVADTSGSMRGGNLALLKEAFTTLVSQLDANDNVSIITYSDQANVVLPATKVADKNTIYAVINSLTANGSTNAASGINLAYQQAEKMYAPGFNNRVILTSDGMANVGSTSPEGILNRITESKDKGIFLTTVGVGQGNFNDHLLEQLANQGNGQYLYLGNTKDIQNNFVDGLTQSLQTVAKDAKVQVIFNEEAVSSYRLLGYENRALKTEDFTDPNKDGGEIGAGHSVTVLYEVKLTEQLSNKDAEASLAEVAVAYKKPMGNKVNTMKKSIPHKVIVDNIGKASPASVLSIAVASFSEKLRQTYWARSYQYNQINDLLNNLPLQYRQQDQVIELQKLLKHAEVIDNRSDDFEAQYPVAQMNFERVPLLD